MPEFLAEIYAPQDAADLVARRAAQAADQPRDQRRQVRLLGAVVVPEEETCFCLYQASSAGAVRAAMAGAGLRPDRITPAVSIWPTPGHQPPQKNTP